MSQRRHASIQPTFSTGLMKIRLTHGTGRSLSNQNRFVGSFDPPFHQNTIPSPPGYVSQFHPVGGPQARMCVVSVDAGDGNQGSTRISLNPGPANDCAANVVRKRGGTVLTVSQPVTWKLT